MGLLRNAGPDSAYLCHETTQGENVGKSHFLDKHDAGPTTRGPALCQRHLQEAIMTRVEQHI